MPALIILGSMALAILVFINVQGGYFLKEFKARSIVLIREKIGLDGEIGSVEAGIFRGIILKDVKLYGKVPPQRGKIPPQRGKVPPQRGKEVFFSSEAIDLDYRLWDIALGRYGNLGKITFVSPKIYFIEADNNLPKIPKVFEPAWRAITVSIKDGSFYNARKIPVMSEVNGNFRLSESGIASQSVSANILGQRFVGRGRVGFPIERSAVKMEGSIKGRGYALKAQLDGVLDKIFVHGSFDILNKLNLDFAGNIAASEGTLAFNDFRFGPKFILNGLLQTAKKGFNIDLYPEDVSGNAAAMGEVSKLSISGDFAKLPYFMLSINANHLKMLGFDLLSNYGITGKFNYGAGNRLESVSGDFSTSGSLINYDPVREIKGAYEFRDGVMKLTGVNYGDVVYANGSFGAGGRDDVDIHFKFKGTQLGGITDLAMEKGTVSGLVFGDMNIRGGLGKEMNIGGQFEFLNGNISTVRYNSAKITLRGKSSTLEFIDSKVYTGDQVLTVEGKIDLKDIGTPRLFRNIVIKSDPNTVVWAGVNITKMPAGEEYVTGANVNEQFRVNLKTYESQQGNQLYRQDAMELEYKLGKPASMKLEMRENEDFFGLEHKVRF